MQVHCAEEAADFQKIASALLVNVGTLSPQWVAGMEAAIGAANKLKKPWVLDPVAAGATPFRTEVRPCDEQIYAGLPGQDWREFYHTRHASGAYLAAHWVHGAMMYRADIWKRAVRPHLHVQA